MRNSNIYTTTADTANDIWSSSNLNAGNARRYTLQKTEHLTAPGPAARRAHDSPQSAALRAFQIDFRANTTSVELTVELTRPDRKATASWSSCHRLTCGGINAVLPCGVGTAFMQEKGFLLVSYATCGVQEVGCGLLLQGTRTPH